jgi:hypothetical protein
VAAGDLLGLRHDFNKGAFWWGSVGLGTLGSGAVVAVGDVGSAIVGAVGLSGSGTLGSGAAMGAGVGSAKLTDGFGAGRWTESGSARGMTVFKPTLEWAGLGPLFELSLGLALVVVANISASSFKAAVSPSWRGASGDGPVGCCRAWIRSLAAAVAASVEDRAGISTWVGNHGSVSATQTERVSGIQIL